MTLARRSIGKTEILERVRRIEAVCNSHGVPLGAAAMQFPLGHPAVASVVVGSRDASEVKANVELVTRALPAALWADLKSEGLVPANAPVPTDKRL